VQTLKTAAIVVLVMTGVYGTYMSMHTPAEPLPEEVQSLLDFGSDSDLGFDIDSGLPESLGSVDIGEPMDFGEEIASPSDMSFSNAGQTGVSPGTSDGVSADQTQIGAAASPTTNTNQKTMGSIVQSGTTSNAGQVMNSGSEMATTTTANGSPSLALTSGTSPSSSQMQPPSSNDVLRADLASETLTPNLGLMNAIQTADRQFFNDKRRDALATLSIFYNAPNMTGEQRSELLARLDPLAAEVIYSKRHLLEQPHRVGQGETLMQIAAMHQVPWQLIANINHISDPVTVLPGTELKVLRGPFRAEVNLRLKELTLFLGDLYAARFPIEIGDDPSPRLGTYTIQDKQTDKTYYDRQGSPIAPGSADNPFGNVWMDLGGTLSIHGSPSTTMPTDRGCISLAADYADDLYGILSTGSSVTIRR
jgi:lipoprotein-anchoring transpeptidase ErfK/SrfK